MHPNGQQTWILLCMKINLTLPPDVAITAVQRESELIMGRDVMLHEGDIVYVMGKEKSMDKVSSLLEG